MLPPSINPVLLEPSRHDLYPFISPSANLKDAARGRIVLITGAGTGIGKGIAHAFARAGARQVIIAARRTNVLKMTKDDIDSENHAGCEVLVRGEVDISDPEKVEALFASLTQTPDVLVQNAAVSEDLRSLADSDVQRWCQEIDVNVKGTYLMCQAFLQAVKRGRALGNPGSLNNARIINVSSNVFWHNVLGRSSYAASKIAVNNITEYIDNECQVDPDLSGTRCVAMNPGAVGDTQLSSQVQPEVRKLLIDKPALPGGTAVYLSTPRADFLMGRFVNATWDMEQLEAQRETVEKADMLRTRVLGVNW